MAVLLLYACSHSGLFISPFADTLIVRPRRLCKNTGLYVFFQQRKTVANTELVVILPARSLVQRQQFSESRSRERENNNLDSFATNLPSYTG